MFNLIKAEYYKILKCTAYKVLLLSISVITFLIVIFISATDITGYDAFIISLTQSQINIILTSIFTGIFICNEFTNRTISSSISSGNSRFLIFLSKIIVYLLGSFILMIMFPLIFISGICFIKGFGKEITNNMISYIIHSILLYFLLNLALASICSLFAFILKSVSATLGTSIGILLLLTGIMAFPASETLTQFYKYTIFWQSIFFINESNNIKLTIIIGVLTFIITLPITYLSFKKADLN